MPPPSRRWPASSTWVRRCSTWPSTRLVARSMPRTPTPQNHVRFEGPGVRGGSTVQGNIARAQITVIDPDTGSVRKRHLNRHIDYAELKAPASVRRHSLSTPLDMQVSSDGAKTLRRGAGLGSGRRVLNGGFGGRCAVGRRRRGSSTRKSQARTTCRFSAGPRGFCSTSPRTARTVNSTCSRTSTAP